jgi:hypothetical protein
MMGRGGCGGKLPERGCERVGQTDKESGAAAESGPSMEFGGFAGEGSEGRGWKRNPGFGADWGFSGEEPKLWVQASCGWSCNFELWN